jgi:hypothetical protein
MMTEITRLDEINKIVNEQVCQDTIEKLSDEHLFNQYKESKSVEILSDKLTRKLEVYINGVNLSSAVSEILVDLIPPGTKGVIRGKAFNKIVVTHIKNLDLDPEKYEIAFEKVCDSCRTTEIPDFHILEKETTRLIIGMNQIDLWSGGQQINRGSKYLVNNKHNTEKSKLLCVISKKIDLKSNKNKAYELFDIGFKNDTLCYVNNISIVCKKFFEIETTNMIKE